MADRSRDGTELFYVEDDALMAVQFSAADELSALEPELLFRHPGLRRPYPEQNYDVSTEGDFLLVDSVDVEGSEEKIQIVENWREEFYPRDQE